MKISVNWLRQFTDIQLSVDELVEKIGAQLGAVEEVIDVGAKYKKVIIARVVTCEKHPNADKLSVCTIDDGGNTPDVNREENGLVQVVCGAPNVREGMLVAWLPPGAIVPSSYDKDPFVLEARELRGVVSNGMLASASELAIGDNHEGILEVDIESVPGTPFADVYQLNDYVIDIENKMFTHRPDCFGILGVAREIAGIQGVRFTSPEWYATGLDRIKPGKSKLGLAIKNEIPEQVPRFMAIAMADVELRASPIIVQSYLSRLGIRPINNIVDITNYLMILTGQPLHAYDYDKVKALDNGADSATIVIRKPLGGETLTLLNGKTIEPRPEAIMIASKSGVIGLGGVMGGGATEVDVDTKKIILEVANFDMYAIRRTSMAHGIFTDASSRFNKGQSPLQIDRVLEEAVALVQSLSGAHVASDVMDDNRSSWSPKNVQVSVDFINQRLGLEINGNDIKSLLENVEFRVDATESELNVSAPFWRTDIEIAEDIVEEVGRLYGYDQIPLVLPRRELMPSKPDPSLAFKKELRNILAAAGANEVLTHSFVNGNLLDKVGQQKEYSYKLSNALSPDLQYYRQSLTPSLLDKIHSNIRAGYDEFALFEMNKVHLKEARISDESDKVAEFERLAFVFTANEKAAKDYRGAAFYQARKYLDHMLSAFGLDGKVSFEPLEPAKYVEANQAKISQYEFSRAATINLGDIVLGEIGEYKASVQKNLKLPAYTAGFELDLVQMRDNIPGYASYLQLSKFPKVVQDITLKASVEVTHGKLIRIVQKALDTLIDSKSTAKLETIGVYQPQKATEHKQVTLRLTIASYERTLKSEEVNALLDSVAAKASEAFGAERV